MSKSLLLAVLFSSSAAFALTDKTFECRNVDNLPNNTYKITMVALAPGITAPFIEIRRYFREKTGDVNSKQIEARMQGVATVSSTEPGSEALLIGALRLEFKDNELLNCRP